jgi:hypothetical protein
VSRTSAGDPRDRKGRLNGDMRSSLFGERARDLHVLTKAGYAGIDFANRIAMKVTTLRIRVGAVGVVDLNRRSDAVRREIERCVVMVMRSELHDRQESEAEGGQKPLTAHGARDSATGMPSPVLQKCIRWRHTDSLKIHRSRVINLARLWLH